MTNSIVFSYVAKDISEHQENLAFINEVYQKRLKYTFTLDKYIRMNDGESKNGDGAELLVVLKLQDGAKIGKKLPNKAVLGVGQLSKRCTNKYIMSFGDMPEVDWGKDQECE